MLETFRGNKLHIYDKIGQRPIFIILGCLFFYILLLQERYRLGTKTNG